MILSFNDSVVSLNLFFSAASSAVLRTSPREILDRQGAVVENRFVKPAEADPSPCSRWPPFASDRRTPSAPRRRVEAGRERAWPARSCPPPRPRPGKLAPSGRPRFRVGHPVQCVRPSRMALPTARR